MSKTNPKTKPDAKPPAEEPGGFPAHPHDALFRLLGAAPRRAATLLAEFLPPEVRERLDPDRLPELIEGASVDAEGKAARADAIFRARLKDGASARIHVLLEHKSQPDARTPLQMMRYIQRIWSREREPGESHPGRVPLVIPMVFYNGPSAWTTPRSIVDMIDAPEGLEHLASQFGTYLLYDLTRMAPEELPKNPETRSALLAMGRVHAEKVTDAEADIIVAGIDSETDFGQFLLQYVATLVLSLDQMKAAMRRTRTEPEEVEAVMETAAQTWLKQGKAAGIVEGRTAGIAEGKIAGIAAGKSETLARLLAHRFGRPLGEVQARIAGADLGQLDRWLIASLDAPTFEAVFGVTPKR